MPSTESKTLGKKIGPIELQHSTHKALKDQEEDQTQDVPWYKETHRNNLGSNSQQ